MSKLVTQSMEEEEDFRKIIIPGNYAGNLVRMAFEFCDMYKTSPFPDIKNPIDKNKALPNYYNDILDDLTFGNVIALLRLSDYLDTSPLMKLMRFKLSYFMRDISYKKRLDYFIFDEEWLFESAEM